MLNVSYGVNKSTAVPGRNVQAIFDLYRQILNLPPVLNDVVALCNGTKVAGDFVPADNSELEFTKPAGTKGLAA